MNKTGKWILLSLNFEEYQIIHVRIRTKRGMVTLGGGCVSRILEEFGELEVLTSYILDNCLYLTVKDDNYTDCNCCGNIAIGAWNKACCALGHRLYKNKHCPYYCCKGQRGEKQNV